MFRERSLLVWFQVKAFGVAYLAGLLKMSRAVAIAKPDKDIRWYTCKMNHVLTYCRNVNVICMKRIKPTYRRYLSD